MTYRADYLRTEPLRSEVEAMPGTVLLEFGAPWCGYCQAAQPAMRAMVESVPDATHLKVEDGKGRPLGRAFGVRLWPTLIVLDHGKERARVVRPTSVDALHHALETASPPRP
jgi:thioredoxin 1